MPGPVTVEICVDSITGAEAALAGGAQRIELCAGLIEGGTTPSWGLTALVCRSVSVPVVALIRPHAGDFLYTTAELDVMRHDIDAVRKAGARGVALGVLREDGAVDARATLALIEHAQPLEITFHRAFDLVRDPLVALDELVQLGVDRVLTSGQASRAQDAGDRIRACVERALGKVRVVAAGGVRAAHARELVEATGVAEVHSSARGRAISKMKFRGGTAQLGAGVAANGIEFGTTDEAEVRRLVDALRD